MEKETSGTVVSVATQWWLKVNSKPVRAGSMDGALFPHVIKVTYTVDGREYAKRKWAGAGVPVPVKGNSVKVVYDAEKPSKARIVY